MMKHKAETGEEWLAARLFARDAKGELPDVPSMHRKHSSNGCRSRIHGRNSGGVRRQV
jgi:hypothetical protein